MLHRQPFVKIAMEVTGDLLHIKSKYVRVKVPLRITYFALQECLGGCYGHPSFSLSQVASGVTNEGQLHQMQ